MVGVYLSRCILQLQLTGLQLCCIYWLTLNINCNIIYWPWMFVRREVRVDIRLYCFWQLTRFLNQYCDKNICLIDKLVRRTAESEIDRQFVWALAMILIYIVLAKILILFLNLFYFYFERICELCWIGLNGNSTIVAYSTPNSAFTCILNLWFVNTFSWYTQLNEQTVLFPTIQFSISQQS